MTKSFPVKKKSRAETRASKLLASVPYDRGFHFFTAVGHYTEETATSLVTFVGRASSHRSWSGYLSF